MANKSKIEHNNKRKRMVAKFSEKRKALKDTIMNRELPLQERFNAQLELTKLPKNGAQGRVRNRCLIDGRPRGYLRRFGMSRIWLRTLAGDGLITGLKKSSW